MGNSLIDNLMKKAQAKENHLADQQQKHQEDNERLLEERDIDHLLEGLSEKQRAVLMMRYAVNGTAPLEPEDLTRDGILPLAKVGQELGITGPAVRDAEVQGLEKVRKKVSSAAAMDEISRG